MTDVVVMKRLGLQKVLTFDEHFTAVGFEIVGREKVGK